MHLGKQFLFIKKGKGKGKERKGQDSGQAERKWWWAF